MKDRRVTIRFTQDEYDYLMDSREDKKTKLSSYVRNIVLSKTGHSDVRIDRQLDALNYQVRKIGVNINQIANKLNADYGDPRDAEHAVEIMTSLNDKVEELARSVQLK